MHLVSTPSLALALALSTPAVSAQETFGEYWPTSLGYSWKFTDVALPSNFYTWDVLTSFPVPGFPNAVKVGPDVDNCFVLENDGTTLTLIGSFDAGTPTVLPSPIPLGAFTDGASFQFSPTDLVVVRDWSNLDPTLLASVGNYGEDPDMEDVVLWVWYDTNESPGAQNPIVESGSGGSPVAFGVTDIDWFQKGVGPIAQQGVDAALGGLLEEHYSAVASFDCNGNQVPDHVDISSATSPDCNTNEVPDDCELSIEVVRLGTPANPNAFLPGQSSGPVIGQTWDPVIDHGSFFPGAFLDIVGISTSPTNLILPGLGTLLCNPFGPTYFFSTAPGTPFTIPIPPSCAIIGLDLCAQGASSDGLVATLTNALDITVGAF